MKLADWLHLSSTTPELLRRRLGVKTRTTFRRYLTGDRKPSREVVQRIEEITGGAVTAEDFEDPGIPECAQFLHRNDGTSAMVFPWSPRRRKEAAMPLDDPEYRPEWKHPTAVLQRAFDILGVRVRLTPRGRFLLDGRPSDARRVVIAANEMLEAGGQEPLVYPTVRRKD